MAGCGVIPHGGLKQQSGWRVVVAFRMRDCTLTAPECTFINIYFNNSYTGVKKNTPLGLKNGCETTIGAFAAEL
jgi:hypothetical protein